MHASRIWIPRSQGKFFIGVKIIHPVGSSGVVIRLEVTGSSYKWRNQELSYWNQIDKKGHYPANLLFVKNGEPQGDQGAKCAQQRKAI